MTGNSRDSCECPDFCGEFLTDLSSELKGKVIAVLHDVLEKKYVDASSKCETLLHEIRGTLEIDSPLYKMILKQLSLSLLKVEESEAGIKLVKQQLDELKKDDFSTLLTLGTIYDKRGEYERSLETYQRANDTAIENDDNLQDAVSLLKLAAINWNLGQPELSRQLMIRGQQAFNQQLPNEGNESNSDELFLLLVEFYKTTAYLYKVTKEHSAEKANYLKALDSIKKRSGSAVQELKVLSHLSLCFANCNDELAVDCHNKRALAIALGIMENNQYLSAHSSQVIHILSRLGFAYTQVRNLDASLQIREKMLNVAKNFLGIPHPEVARIAADIAILCQRLHQPRRLPEFVDIVEKSLEECNHRNDETKMKLYVREVTDALSNYGFFHSLQSNYAAAEENYKEALSISIKVYGECSPRTAKFMRFLGKTYNRWGKTELAISYLNKCLVIIEKFQPDKTDLINSIKTEIANSGVVRRKGFKY